VLNILSGLFLLIAPWLVPNTGALLWSSVLVGWAVIVLAIVRGVTHQRIGDGWWAAVAPQRVYGETRDQRR
jgi:hypothetical protein